MNRTVRAYLPGTLATIRTLRDQRGLPPGVAYAVTPALRAEFGQADQEELEYEAFTQAAQASLDLLRAEPSLPRRRVVIAVDVPARLLSAAPADRPRAALADRPGAAPADRADGPPAPTGRVALAGPVPLAAVVAIHLDSAAAAAEVAAVLAGAAEEVEYELEWYDVSELDRLPG